LAGDPVEVADEEQPQEHFRINRGAPGRTIRALQPIPHKAEIDVAIDQPEQMRLGNLILQAEGVEEAFLLGLLPHHRERPPPFHYSRRRGERRVKSRFSTASFLSDPTWRAFRRSTNTPLSEHVCG